MSAGRALVIIALATASARADDAAPRDVRFVAGPGYVVHRARRGSLEPDRTAAGPALAFDAGVQIAPGLVVAVHLGWILFWYERTDPSNTPHYMRVRNQLPHAHAMLEYRAGPVSVGAGAGFDLFLYQVVEISDGAVASGDNSLSFGVHAQLAVDVWRRERDRFSVVGLASRSPIGGPVDFDDGYANTNAVWYTVGIAYQRSLSIPAAKGATP